MRYVPCFYHQDYLVGEDGSVWRNGKRLRPNVRKSGYLSVCLGGRTLALHRVVLASFEPPPFPDAECMHKDGIKSNCSLANLSWGSKQENLADSVNVGLTNDKLTPKIAGEIYQAVKAGLSFRQAARKFGVSASTVSDIMTGKRRATLTH